MKKWGILAIFLLGLSIRLVLLAAPGNEDMRVDQIWGVLAVERGISRVYVYDDAHYIEKFFQRWNRIPSEVTRTSVPTALGILDHVPDYPPLAMYIFAASARLGKELDHGGLQSGPILNACFNLIPVLALLGIVGVCYSFSRRRGVEFAWFPLALFWLNPSMILHSPVLGYFDPAYAFLGLCALVSLYEKKYSWAAMYLATATMTKPQAVLLVPIVGLVLWMETDRPIVRRTILIFALFILVPFLPFVATGHFLAAVRGIAQVTYLDYLSSNQFNFWWLVNWILATGSGGSLADPVHIVRISNPESSEFLGLRAVVAMVALALTVINLRWLWQQLRRGNRMAIFWSAALQVYIFTSVSLHPKENHLYGFFVYLLPILFLAKRPIVVAYAALSLVFGMNLFLFDGFGMGFERPGHALRILLGFDLTVLVAALNGFIFMWLVTRPRWLFDLTAMKDASAVRNGN